MEGPTPALNQIALAIAAHPLRPEIEHRVTPAGRSLAETLAAEGVLPGAWAVSVGGVDVPAEYWPRVRVKPGHLIECRAVVRKQVLQIAAIAALSYFTMGMGGFAAGSFMGLSGAAGAIAAGTAFVAGSIVINKLLPPANAKMGGGTAERAVSYGISGGRNTARPYQPLGLMLGECKVVPDLAGQQFTWFEGDDQYLSCLLHAGINCGSVHSLRLGDTLLSDYSDVQVTRVGFPAGNDGQMPSTSVDSVAGGLLDRPDDAEPEWTVRTTSRDTVRIAVDIEASVTSINNSGNWQSASVSFDAEYRPTGGAWVPFLDGRISLTNASGKPVRRTLTIDVPAAQYEVRLRKVDRNATSTQQQNTVTWTALKSYQADTADYAGQARVRVEVKATGQLSGSLDTVNWIGRAAAVPVWTGTEWVEATEPGAAGISNPGAQLLMLMRGIRRPSDGRLIAGLGLPDSKIDIESLKAFMVRCAAKGFRFDDFVQEAMTIEDLLEAIADVGFGRLSRSTGKYGVVWLAEDQPVSGVINMATMKARSFSVDYDLLPTAEEAQYDFYDAQNGYTQQSVRVVSPLAVTTPNRQASVSVRGINFATHAAQRARLMLGQSAYARKSISWEMDLEYMVYSTGALVALSHDLTQWGAGGRVVSFSRNTGNWTIGLDVELPVVDGAVRMMALALPREKTMRVFPVASIAADRRSITVAQAWPADLPAPGEGADVLDTTWLFDIKATPGYRCRVVAVQPNSGMTGARITAVPEAPEMWEYVWNGAWTQPAGDSLLARLPPVAMNAAVSAERVRLGETWRTELTVTFDVAGNYDHAQVWGAVSGGPMELLEANVYGTRASWFADRGQQWTVEVRPFDSLGRMGTVATVAYSVAGDVPAEVADLAVTMTEQGAVAAWTRPDGLQGVDWSLTEIRVGASWLSGSVAFSGRADSFNLGWLAAGTTTVWASHRNTAGDWSEPVTASLAVLAPDEPLVSTGRDQSTIRLDWQDCRTSQPLRGYRIVRGAALAGAVALGTVAATTYTRVETAAGLQRYWVLAEDVAGNLSDAGTAQVEVLPSAEGVLAGLDLATTELGQQLLEVIGSTEGLNGELAELAEQVLAIANGDAALAAEILASEQRQAQALEAKAAELQAATAAVANDLQAQADQVAATAAGLAGEAQIRAQETADQAALIAANAAAIQQEAATLAAALDAQAGNIAANAAKTAQEIVDRIAQGNTLGGQICSVSSAVGTQATRVDALVSRADGVDSSIVTLQQTNAGQALRIDALQVRTDTLTTQVTETVEATGDLAQKVVGLVATAADTDSAVHDLSEAGKGYARTLASLRVKTSEAESLIIETREVTAEQATQLLLISTRVGENESGISTLNQTTATLATRATGLETRASNAEGRIQIVESTTAGQASQLTSLTGRVVGAESGIQTLNIAQAAQASQLTTLQSRADGVDSTVTVLSQTQAGQATQLADISTRVGNAEASVSSLSQTSAGYATRIGAVEVKAGDALTRVGLVEEATAESAFRLVDLSAQVGGIDSAITDLSRASEGSAQTLRALRVKSGQAESSIRELNTVTATQATRQVEMQTQLGTAVTNIASLSQTTSTLATQQSGLTARVDGAEGRIFNTETVQAQQASRLSTVEVQSGSNTGRIQGLETVTASTATRTDSLEARATGFNASIAALEQVSPELALMLVEMRAAAADHDSQFSELRKVSADSVSAMRRLQFKSGAAESAIVRVDRVAAGLATSVEQISARTSGVESDLSAESIARANTDGALSSRIDTVTATANGASAAVQTVQQAQATTDGKLNAMYAIKVAATADGKLYQAGIGVGVENAPGGMQTQVYALADRFAVLNLVNGVVATPFVIQDGQVVMNSALIGNASIGTLQLAGESVTVPRFVAFTNSTYWTPYETQVFSYQLTLPAAATVLISCKASPALAVDADWRGYYRVYVNGVERFVRNHGYKQAGNYALPFAVDLQFCIALAAGTHTIAGTWQVNANPAVGSQGLSLTGTELFVLGTMR
ncbi:hypothetical protein GCM10007242_44760 [Pigmentiphaga litoralis]|uniref:host specificity factor TipJ family phage tail protein n=1 Tax=Pigmentiphaga litoralis TaxID=516702 RepID=UPI00167A0FCC|nr:host specificity factor TipJ family phage tail protein [Pigmentiphaga litoralis]GGX32842.1 hypothetical protein GCM10007242_44760 [Pigmentiphaga litoralis]